MKKIIISIVVVLLLIVAVVFVITKTRPSQTPPTSPADSNKSVDDNKPATNQPAKTKLDLSHIIMGEVTSAQSGEIRFKANNTEYTAQISGSTKLLKQAVATDGAIKQATATVADFTAGRTIVVYFDSPSEKGTYKQVSTIQIIK